MNTVEFKLSLGTKVLDKVSGYIGIIDGRAEHLNGCHRYSVQGPVGKDGTLTSGWWIDEVQLEVLEEDVIKHTPVKTGGPMSRRR